MSGLVCSGCSSAFSFWCWQRWAIAAFEQPCSIHCLPVDKHYLWNYTYFDRQSWVSCRFDKFSPQIRLTWYRRFIRWPLKAKELYKHLCRWVPARSDTYPNIAPDVLWLIVTDYSLIYFAWRESQGQGQIPPCDLTSFSVLPDEMWSGGADGLRTFKGTSFEHKNIH